ncbi:M20/M25/M40 family metallo-hydrolase [Kitasatospora sp. NBC_01250]|uniref:M20/M25/M40 family metallo-hydrolase n=1 Tax=unclassified Kitasatospora TaxID=2633591 RepID=UPI002E14D893|nr:MULTISPECIES: M20/M25/M40 family metallo-hydrolase [unclassified Kitasatospora]WSJ68109.1 M20/M25/M40 family metallo-hydrolase [Kitasatospora sp. NBC_01302]
MLTATDHQLLLDLLELPTAGPLEAPGLPSRLWDAQRAYAGAAAELGFEVLHHAAPAPAWAELPDVPLPVRSRAADPGFLAEQPSLVLRLGPAAARERTVMFNVHLDTVAGQQPVHRDGDTYYGRGAVDAKGPAVALLAGLRAALAERPGLARRTTVLVQAVSGEEGGALGTLGTRPLVAAGHYGRLNVFCEPTGNRALTRCTAAMTARIEVAGQDAVDDQPAAGHNATVLLGFLAQHLAASITPGAGRLCVAGLHTGRLHNRVYGQGELLLNLAYPDPATAERLERAVAEGLAAGLRAFAEKFAANPLLARTAVDAAAITSLHWLKRGLPALAEQRAVEPWLPHLLDAAQVAAWPAAEPGFTCDAIWLADRPGTATVVLGPGSLEGNNAHAEGEFVRVEELTAFARAVAGLLLAFDGTSDPTDPRTTAPALPHPAQEARPVCS